MTRISYLLTKIAKDWSVPELYDLSVEYNKITPNFKIVKFDQIDNFSAIGTGEFTSTNTDMVQSDIALANSFAEFLDDEYGTDTQVNYSIRDNQLDIEIKVLQMPKEVKDKVVQHLESLILKQLG